MSGAGMVGAQPNIDIVTKNVDHSQPGFAKRQSDVAVTVPLDVARQFTIGIMVKTKQAASATLAITSPSAMAVVKEAGVAGPEATKLKQAFPPLAGHRWLAFTGTTPPASGTPAAVTNLQTELTVDASQIPAHGFQVVPIVVHYSNTDWKTQHYLVGASIVPGPQQTAVAMRTQRGRGQASGPARTSRGKARRKR